MNRKGGSVSREVRSAGDDALSATTDVLVDWGSLDLTATDKGINAGVFAFVDAGSVTVSTDDDGIHSDGALRVSDGTVRVFGRRRLPEER